jgi:hypothetical protein
MAHVRMPDGTVVEMPDKLTPELAQRLQAFRDAKTPLTGGDIAAGSAEAVGSAAAAVPVGAANAVVDLYRRLTGGNTEKPKFNVPTGAAERHLFGRTGELIRQMPDLTEDQKNAIREQGGIVPGDISAAGHEAFNSLHPIAQDLLRETGGVVGDVANLAGAYGAVKSVAGVGGKLLDLATAPGEEAGAAGAAGLRTPSQNPTAAAVAGKSGQQALVQHTQKIGDTIAASEAGHPLRAPFTAESLAAAREAPSSVYNRVASALPEGGLDDVAQREIASAGQPEGGRMTAGTPQAQQSIEALRTQLTGPRNFTGEQMVNELRGLRQEGFANAASEDVSNQQLGRAQLDMARAIEGHIGRNIPANADVSLDQFQQARVALAKNYAVQAAAKGGSIDLQALARASRAEPGVMTGGLRTLADFADENPTITTMANRQYQPPGYLHDVLGSGSSLTPESLLSPGKWADIFGARAAARRFLTGNTDSALERANRMFPARSPEQFGPIARPPAAPNPDIIPFEPPPGPAPLSAHPPGAPPAAPAGPPGQIPLADLLSHGVEQSPPAGLSLAQELGAGGPYSPQGGIPFRAPAGHLAGDLQLPEHPEDAWFSGPRENVSQLPHVMSQGVPEGTVARAQQPRRVAALQFPGGQPTSMLANNASGESAASLEAISRGTRNIVRYNGESAEPIMRDVTQVDRNAPKGAIHIDADTGEIVSRGSNLSQRQATALRNRWASENRKVPLADELTTE